MNVPSYPRPKKRLGQHFLVDHNIIKKIMKTADLAPHNTVLEIGPGCGALTRGLCQAVSRVIAVEVDSELVAYLHHTLSDCSNLEIRHEDALKFPYHTLPPDTVVVANLPYHIASPLLFHLFAAKNRINRMVLMLQLEVARRLVATAGSREYGTLSVSGQYFSCPTIAFKISRTCFSPRPNVVSAAVHFTMRGNQSRSLEEESDFMRIVRAGFAHRRKTVGNSFRDSGYALMDIQRAFHHVGIDLNRRAETLTGDEFSLLAKVFQGVSPTISSPQTSVISPSIPRDIV